MNGGWFIFSVLLVIITGISITIATRKVSLGVAAFAFGFALAIWADEIAGGDKKRNSTNEHR